jgi:hypothetical protein
MIVGVSFICYMPAFARGGPLHLYPPPPKVRDAAVHGCRQPSPLELTVAAYPQNSRPMQSKRALTSPVPKYANKILVTCP